MFQQHKQHHSKPALKHWITMLNQSNTLLHVSCGRPGHWQCKTEPGNCKLRHVAWKHQRKDNKLSWRRRISENEHRKCPRMKLVSVWSSELGWQNPDTQHLEQSTRMLQQSAQALSYQTFQKQTDWEPCSTTTHIHL